MLKCTRATTAQSGYQPYCQISTLLVSRDLHGVSKKTMANKYVPSKEGFNSARKFGLNSFDSKLTWLHILDTFPFIATSRVMMQRLSLTFTFCTYETFIYKDKDRISTLFSF